MKLLKVDTSEEVRKKIDLSFANPWDKYDHVHLEQALGRIAYEDVFSPIELPEFSRSVVDGYAVIASDTYGAGESMPVFLDVTGHVEMGKKPLGRVTKGTAIYTPTGAMIPDGADAVVMIEDAEVLDENTIAVYTSVAPGHGIIKKGDDVSLGQKVLSKGSKISPRDIGVLAALGIGYIKVFKKIRVSVISTGDEIVDSFGGVREGEIRDINTHLLSAMVEESGGSVNLRMLVKDDFNDLRNAILKALEESEIVLLSGGSSVGAKDMTRKAIESIDRGEVFVHGVAIKPGKPTIIGKAGDKAIFGLPGHPSSAMVIYKVFVDYLIRKYYCLEEDIIYIEAICEENIHSAPGKETYQTVEIVDDGGVYRAVPVYGKSAAITTVAKSRGYIKISENREGIKKGEKVRVDLF